MEFEPFLANLMKILEKSGFPDKRVALPLEKLYEAAYQKQLNLNKALDILQARGISHEKTSQKIIFFRQSMDHPFSHTETPNMAGMMAQAQEMMRQLTPEQRKDLEEKVLNMNEEERSQILKMAKEMGLGS